MVGEEMGKKRGGGEENLRSHEGLEFISYFNIQISKERYP